MLYDIRLNLHYEYASPVEGGRHLLRVTPPTLPGVQRVLAASLDVAPPAAERTMFRDFFDNEVTTIAYREAHDALDVTMKTRVEVERAPPAEDISAGLDRLEFELASLLSLAPSSPQHFLATTEFARIEPAQTAYAKKSVSSKATVAAVARDLCRRIRNDFEYLPDVTSVSTTSSEAFALRQGVCQDFAHVMIAGLRGLGIPAGYVSGFIRTIPPPGKQRLEGADAMHAWVRVWCGHAAGWLEFDPTNDLIAGPDHIVIGYGRDYGDVAPIVGILRTSGSHDAEQSVDVIPVASATGM